MRWVFVVELSDFSLCGWFNMLVVFLQGSQILLCINMLYSWPTDVDSEKRVVLYNKHVEITFPCMLLEMQKRSTQNSIKHNRGWMALYFVLPYDNLWTVIC